MPDIRNLQQESSIKKQPLDSMKVAKVESWPQNNVTSMHVSVFKNVSYPHCHKSWGTRMQSLKISIFYISIIPIISITPAQI